MKSTVYIPDAELQQFLRKLKTASEEVKKKAAFELTATALDIDRNAKKFCPVKFGVLKGSIKHRKLTQDGLNHAIFTNVKYAVAVEKGTSAHKIVPKNAPRLAFMVGGKLVFAKEVMHPGTRAQPYLRPAYLLGVNRFYARMRNLIP